MPLSAAVASVADVENAGTAICLMAFNDENENGQRDAGEGLRANVAFTLATGQRVVSNYVTTGTNEPYCIEGLSAGNYQISRSHAPDEALTTQGDWGIALTDGSIVTLEFGSYTDKSLAADVNTATNSLNVGSEAVQAAQPDDGVSSLITVGAIGLAVLLLLGVILLIMSARQP